MSLWNSMPLAKTVANLITAIFDIWPFIYDLDPKLWVNFEWTFYIYFEHCEFKKKIKKCMFNIYDFGKTSMKELELIVKIFNPLDMFIL